MAEKTDDIARYRKGEMSPAEMHAFERRADSDAFLKDALEGAESISANDFEADAESLTKRIRTRVTGAKTYFYWTMRAAAALVLLAVATFIIVNYENDSSSGLPAGEEAVSSPQVQQPETLAAEDADKDIESGPTSPKPPQEVARVEDEGASGKNEQPTVDLIASESRRAEKEEPETKTDEIASIESKSVDPAVADTLVALPQGRAVARAEYERAAGDQKESLESVLLITGRVTDAQNHPISGANVRLSDSRVGTLTDEQGKYQLSVPSIPSSVTFSNVGYEPREVSVTQPMIDVTLQEGERESVQMAVSYSDDLRKKSPATRILLYPEPVGGREAFDQYLEDAVRYPDAAARNKVEGRVVIEFVVDAAGKPQSFVIVKGLGYGCEEELIRLINQGPSWLPAMKDGVAVPVTVRVKYRFALR